MLLQPTAMFEHCLRSHPMSSNGTRGWILPRIFRTVTVGNISRSFPSPVHLLFRTLYRAGPTGNLPALTQTCYHFISRCFTDLCISRHLRVSPVNLISHFTHSLGNFSVLDSTPGFYPIGSIYFLVTSHRGIFPLVSAPC